MFYHKSLRHCIYTRIQWKWSGYLCRFCTKRPITWSSLGSSGSRQYHVSKVCEGKPLKAILPGILVRARDCVVSTANSLTSWAFASLLGTQHHILYILPRATNFGSHSQNPIFECTQNSCQFSDLIFSTLCITISATCKHHLMHLPHRI